VRTGTCTAANCLYEDPVSYAPYSTVYDPTFTIAITDDFRIVPEPDGVACLGLGAMGLMASRRRVTAG